VTTPTDPRTPADLPPDADTTATPAAVHPLRVSPQRIRAATALRALGHAIVAHDAADDELDAVATWAEQARKRIEASPRRQRPIGAMKSAQFSGPPPAGEPLDHFPDCVVSGKANPLGIAITAVQEGDEAVARVVLGPAFEGAPGRSHGGVVAAVFDDTLGYVLLMERTPAYTGRLSVTYRAPTPVNVPLEFRARLVERRGRKLTITGEARHGDTVVAEAEGLFITVDLERFAAGGQAPDGPSNGPAGGSTGSPASGPASGSASGPTPVPADG
jgi:acyl-coenzyme A thioesterase PaaI-like protein